MTKPIRAHRLSRPAGFILAAVFASAAPASAAVQVDDAVMVAKAVVQWISQGDVARAFAEFNEETKQRLPQEKLSEIWQGFVSNLGPYEGVEGVRLSADTGQSQVTVICRFERSVIHAKLTFDSACKVSGLWFAPGNVPEEAAAAAAAPTTTPTPPLRGMQERQVTVGSAPWILPATLTLPAGKGPFSAVVLVHGSGPHDRDETIGPNKPFRDLAIGLAAEGIAVLRYEKRTKEHAAALAALKDSLTLKEETVEDAVVAAALLRRSPGIDPNRVFVLGHSLGGMAVPRIARADGKLAGGIILAGTTRALEDVIVDQVRYLASLDGRIEPSEQMQLEQMQAHARRIKNPGKASDVSLSPPFGVPLAYWLDLQAYQPVQEAARLALPLLILQGERDYQVTLVDFAGWKQGLSGQSWVSFKTYPDLNHLFIRGRGISSPAEYEQPGHMDPEVITDIAQWIARQ